MQSDINYQKFDEWWPEQLHILSRASPDDKQTLVRAIMNSRKRPGGEIVAVTASGIEDGPVLRTADIGITMVTFWCARGLQLSHNFLKSV